MKWKHPIDLHKGLTPLVVLGLMAGYDNWSVAPWVYLGLHGTYGVMWVFKSYTFPDANWEKEVPLWFAAATWIGLLGYWAAPFLLISRGVEPPGWVVGLAVALVVFGTLLHFGSDAQKYFTLQARKGLITTGFFRATRNPNYLGEILLYAGFATLSMHWIPWVVNAAFWLGVFLPNMLRKDRRMARHEGWDAYVAHTGMLLPRLGLRGSGGGLDPAR